MPVNKNQWERLQTILGILRKGLFVNYRSFMEEMLEEPDFYISPKTFSRDIMKLRQLGAPVKYHPRKKGFYLTDREWNMALPTESGSMKMLLLSERVARNFLPPQMRKELREAVDHILLTSETEVPEHTSVAAFQVIAPEFSPDVDSAVFKEVYEAWERSRYLKISYCSIQGHCSDKLIVPRMFAWDNGCWYVKGYVAKENGIAFSPPWDIRVFALHRIQKAEMTPGVFIPGTEDFSRFKGAGIFDFKKLPEVELEFFQPELKRIRECFASNSAAITAQTENSLTVHLEKVSEYTVWQLIFRSMGNVRIIKPASLQKSLRQVAQRIFDNMDLSAKTD